MKNFIWIINGDEGFGIARATLVLAKQLKEDNKRIEFLSISNGKLLMLIEKEGFHVYKLDITPNEYYKESLFYFFKSILNNAQETLYLKKLIEKKLKGKDYSHLIYRSPNLTGVISLLNLINLQKVWIMPNVIGDSYPLAVNKKLYQIACYFGKIRVFANSKYTASTFNGGLIKADVLYLGVDENQFNPNDIAQNLTRKELGIPADAFVYGVFARLHYTKAQDIVIESLFHLKQKYSSQPFSLLLVGVDRSSDFFIKCNNLIKELNLDTEVICVETVSDIQNFYPLVDVMINSRRDAEPFGLTVIESMMMGKPILALGKGGPSETILEGKTGWLILEPNSSSFFKGMEKAYLNKCKFKEMSITGRKHAIENFSSSAYFSRFKEYLVGQ